MREPLVRAACVSKTYAGTRSPVLLDVSFAIEAGSRIALTGPSGSGKTTLLHLLAGLDVPTSGLLEWPGLGGGPEGLRPGKVALAFQSESLLPALSVAENVALPLLLGGASEAEAAAKAGGMLERMGIGELAERLPEELSGGQAQRVALARALAAGPQLLLADEPTGQQDHAHAEALVDLLLDCATESGTAVLVATHDPRVAARLAQRWELDDGVLVTEAC